jgi:hypothetical protein
MLNGPDIRLAHVATGGHNLSALETTQFLGKKTIYCFSPLAKSDPKNTRAFEIIDNRCILSSFAIGDFVDSDVRQPPDSMAFSYPGNGTVKHIRQGGCRYFQEFGGGFLRHDSTITQQQELKPIGDSGMLRSPWNIFLNTAMFPAVDLPWTVHQKDLFAADRDVPPYSRFVKGSDYFATPVTLGTTGTVFMRFDFKPEFFAPIIESEINDTISFYFQQFLDKLQYAHGNLFF